VVSLDGRILEKPRDRAHAVEMLTALSGRTCAHPPCPAPPGLWAVPAAICLCAYPCAWPPERLRWLGRRHTVWSGVALLYRPGGAAHGAATAEPQELVFAEETVVTFAALPAAAIESYVDSGEPMDKAGCATRTLAQSSHLAFWRPGAWRLSRLASALLIEAGETFWGA